MGRRPEHTFFQRGNADDQQAHERMLNMPANHQENANQNHNITSHLSEWLSCLSSKRTQIKNGGKDVEKKDPSYTVGGTVNWCS